LILHFSQNRRGRKALEEKAKSRPVWIGRVL
jgi:hypothetical protein